MRPTMVAGSRTVSAREDPVAPSAWYRGSVPRRSARALEERLTLRSLGRGSAWVPSDRRHPTTEDAQRRCVLRARRTRGSAPSAEEPIEQGAATLARGVSRRR